MSGSSNASGNTMEVLEFFFFCYPTVNVTKSLFDTGFGMREALIIDSQE